MALLLLISYLIRNNVNKAFDHIDKALEISSQTVSISNDSLKSILLKDKAYGTTVEELEKISLGFHKLIDSTMNELISQTGGWKKSDKKDLENPRNKDVPTQILVEDKLGDEIEKLISETSKKYNAIIQRELNADSIEIPLKLNMNHLNASDKSWAEYNFNQMPLYAVLPIFRKYKQDEYLSIGIIYSHLASEK